MSYNFPDATFENAVRIACANADIMYGFGPSPFHVEIEEDRYMSKVFQSADAEYSFRALVAVAEKLVVKHGKDQSARNTFAELADWILQNFPFTFEVAKWLAIANVLIVGVDEYKTKFGHTPVNMDMFVYDYMEMGAEYALRGIHY
jgi:hypothetical protein